MKRFLPLPLLPFALVLALLIPTGAGAGVKQESDDAAVRLPAAIFGSQAVRAAANVAFDGHDKDDKDKEKDKDKKKDDEQAAAEEQQQAEPPPAEPAPAEEVPEASWSG